MGKKAYLKGAPSGGAEVRGEPAQQGGSHSILSFFSIGSILSAGSVLSIGSAGSVLSIGSVGSILSIGSSGSILSIGSAGSILGLGSAGFSPFRVREEDEDDS